MIDIHLIRQHPDYYKKATKDKGFDDTVIDALLELDEKRRGFIQVIDAFHATRNTFTKDDIEKGRKLKIELKEKEEKLKVVEQQFRDLLLKVPNPSADDVKIGSEKENEVVRTVGTIPNFSFPPKDHVALGELTGTLDLERGAKVAQSGFYYFKGDLALLELALAQYTLQYLEKRGFIPVITPHVAKERNIVGCGFQARSDKERQIYHIEQEDLDLIATAEITLVGLHTDEILDEKQLPLKYVGYSSCYRKEIGSYGKDVRGILRVHEFKKVEMVVFCKPEESDAIHEELLTMEEELYQKLGIPYRVVKMASGDLGNAASKKYDLEAWMPSQQTYREITSTSNTTDFQARRLNIKYRKNGKNEFVHTLNGTVATTSRTIIAILENYQNEDGSVRIPDILQPLMGKRIIERK